MPPPMRGPARSRASARRGTAAPGEPWPLGASVSAAGVNVSVFSRGSTALELLLFDGPDAARPARTTALNHLESDPVLARTKLWRRWLDTARPAPDDVRVLDEAPPVGARTCVLVPHSLVVLVGLIPAGARAR